LRIFDGSAETLLSEDGSDAFNPEVLLSEEFFESLIDRSVPFDIRALKGLASTKSPLAMDLYVWCTWKAQTDKKVTSYPYADLMRQFGSMLDPAKRDDRKLFKRHVVRALKHIIAVWPELRVDPNARARGMSALQIRSRSPHLRERTSVLASSRNNAITP